MPPPVTDSVVEAMCFQVVCYESVLVCVHASMHPGMHPVSRISPEWVS